jgi:hypothetical protein
VANVHFWGVENVLKAYDQRGVESWAVVQSKQLLNKGDNREDLATYLKTLWQDSTAVFTLNFYERDVDSVKPTTPNDGSFNFKLNLQNHGSNVGGNDSLVLSELNAMKLKFAEWESDEDNDEDPEPDMLERISGLLEKPAIIGLINKFTGLNMQPIGKVGNVPPGENNDREIETAIAVLKTKDPYLGKHLTKLATMATTNPANFQFLLSTLDSLP